MIGGVIVDYNQSVDVTIHRLAREALQKRRTTAKGVELELQKELEALSEEVKELVEQLPVDKGAALKTYLEKMRLLSEQEGDYLYFQGAKDCMELFEKLGQAREKE